VFDDKSLLEKTVEFAVQPPLVVLTQDTKSILGPSFKEVANFNMTDEQKDTMNALVEDDKKIEKLRGAKMSITIDEPAVNSTNTIHLRNGPIDLESLVPQQYYSSFLQTSGDDGTYSKPISVKMKMPSEPDGKIKSEINKMEKRRKTLEETSCKKAISEFKLITALTIKELQKNLEQELIPYFVVSKKTLDNIKSVISSNVPSQTQSRFLQIDNEEIKFFFPHYKDLDPIQLNKEIYSKVLNLFSERNNQVNRPVIIKEPPKAKRAVDFNYEKCIEMSIKFRNLNLKCDDYKKDYKDIDNYIKSSFLQTSGGEEEFINVKFASAEDSYPTIEKLVAQMMTRRDLAEKFLRLKILEMESHLQKAENEMIQDVLHVNLYRIMAKFGPAIEGIREHIK
jgi:hypothetical protein